MTLVVRIPASKSPVQQLSERISQPLGSVKRCRFIKFLAIQLMIYPASCHNSPSHRRISGTFLVLLQHFSAAILRANYRTYCYVPYTHQRSPCSAAGCSARACQYKVKSFLQTNRYVFLFLINMHCVNTNTFALYLLGRWNKRKSL